MACASWRTSGRDAVRTVGAMGREVGGQHLVVLRRPEVGGHGGPAQPERRGEELGDARVDDHACRRPWPGQGGGELQDLERRDREREERGPDRRRVHQPLGQVVEVVGRRAPHHVGAQRQALLQLRGVHRRQPCRQPAVRVRGTMVTGRGATSGHHPAVVGVPQDRNPRTAHRVVATVPPPHPGAP